MLDEFVGQPLSFHLERGQTGSGLKSKFREGPVSVLSEVEIYRKEGFPQRLPERIGFVLCSQRKKELY